MSPGIHKKFSQGEFKGRIREDLFSLLPVGFFEDPISSVQRSGSEVLKASRWRVAVIFSVDGKRKIFLKRDRTKNWIDSLKYLILPSKGRKEWFIAYESQRRRLDVPNPLGWMERGQAGVVKESYYLSEAIGSGASLIDSVHLGTRFPLEELAKSVRRIHQAGLFHKDLHAGNFLWDGQSLFLTDLHRAEIMKTISLKRRLWNLSHLFHSLRDTWGEKDQERFIDLYFEGESVSPHQKNVFLRQIRSGMERLQKRQWKSRTKRCVKESTEFAVERGKGVHYYHRRDYPLGRVKEAVEEHVKLVRDDPSKLLKHSPKINVSILKVHGENICVKQFKNFHVWDRFRDRFRTSKGLKAWLGGNGLRARAIPSLKSLALVEERDWLALKESFFITEVSDRGRELDRYIFEGLKDFAKRRHFIRAFAEWLAHFHQRGLYHRDMKTCNVFISENGVPWNFYLLDLEDLLLEGKVSEKKLFRSLLQLNTSIPKTISRTDRLRFLKNYTSLHPIIKDEKGFIRQLVQQSKERGIVYVSPHGVVEENWV
jgi:tRNA A-37 threonylcarbamoyl transferase component Bud32